MYGEIALLIMRRGANGSMKEQLNRLKCGFSLPAFFARTAAAWRLVSGMDESSEFAGELTITSIAAGSARKGFMVGKPTTAPTG